MGAPKKYERTDLLDRAIELFRRQGFNGTSTADLATELGVNRKSMYAEFGSKQGLFEAALERYETNNLTRVLATLEGPNAGIEAIKAAFAGYAGASASRFNGLGCLMCNTAVERAALEPGSARFVRAYFERLQRAFEHALTNAQKHGHLRSGTSIPEVASLLVTTLIGFAASLRAKAPAEQMWASSRVLDSFLDGLAQA